MSITVAKQVDVRSNLKKFFDMACDGVIIMIPRKENKNIAILSEKEYQELEKIRKNAQYLKMLDESDKQLKSGKTVTKTMSELETMANE